MVLNYLSLPSLKSKISDLESENELLRNKVVVVEYKTTPENLQPPIKVKWFKLYFWGHTTLLVNDIYLSNQNLSMTFYVATESWEWESNRGRDSKKQGIFLLFF